ncbi:MAG: bacterioferritin-associated ferredoxin [Pseudomonadales bacterium]|nr:bacterioferritin-associated ferredoxin [Pseudomonadales bacterium]
MYICICKGITDSDIRNAVIDGASDMRSVRKQLGVSTQCGQCSCQAKSVFQEAMAELADSNAEGLFYAA